MGAGRNEAGRAAKISHIKTTTLMSKKTPQSTAAGKANVSHTITTITRNNGPVFHVGLDVHAADFTAAIAEPGRDGEVRALGTFTCDLHALEKLMARLRKAHPEGTLHVAYEAGPTGFTFARRLAQLGIACTVAAPSLIPVRPGERIKTDRRDPAQKQTLEEYLMAITAAEERTARCEEAMRTLLVDWRRRPAVEALMGCRGFALIASMIVVSELGDCTRFAHPRQLMAYVGLVPTENSSGASKKKGGITKAGNGHLRWILVESAQHVKLPPKVSQELSRRQEGLTQKVKDLSWKMQTRLYARHRKLAGRMLMSGKIQVALAREQCGFIWALLREIAPLPEPLPTLESATGMEPAAE